MESGGTFVDRDVKIPILWQLAGNDTGVVTAYGSGKIVIQGQSSEWIDGVVDVLERENGGQGKGAEFIPRIGADEAGKGDFFGPLVVAAVFIETEAQEKELRKSGVRDSKSISDEAIQKIAGSVKEICPAHSVVSISPKEYNARIKERNNANIVLAEGHASAIENVLGSIQSGVCGLVLIDQFSKSKARVLDELHENGSKMRVEQRHKGESDAAVAAASILARARFLEELAGMGERYGMTVPKGASDVIESGKHFVDVHGADALDTVDTEKNALSLSLSWTINQFQRLYASFSNVKYDNLLNPDTSNYTSNSFSLNYSIMFDGFSY